MCLFKSKYSIILLIIVSIWVFPLFKGELARADNKSELIYLDGRLTLKAVKTPLLPLLKKIAESTGIDISISKELGPDDISAQIVDQPLESALKRILQGFNYAVIYSKDGDSWRINALKIYPKGKHGGELIPIFAASGSSGFPERPGETKTVLVHSGDEFRIYGKLGDGGLLIPSRSVPNFSDQTAAQVKAPWFQLQKRLERKEARQYEKLMLQKKRLEAARDPDRKEALAMAYADEVEKFYTMKKANFNKIEALKRIYQFREMTQKQ